MSTTKITTHRQRRDQPQFLANYCKNEISVMLGNEAQLLAAVAQSDTPKSAGG